MSVHRPLAVQLILGSSTSGSLSLARTCSANKAGLRLRWIPLHHVLSHKHSGGSLLGNTVDLTIHQYHDDSRGEEGHEARGQDVPRLVVQKTLLPLFVTVLLHQTPTLLFLGHEERRGRDDDGYQPHNTDHHLNPLGCPFAVVADSFSYRPVAVEADGAEMDDG